MPVSLRKSTLKLFVFLGYVCVPASALMCFLLTPKRPETVFFLAFFVFHSLERVWETFYTSKEKKAFELHGDWTLAIVTAMYILLCFFSIFEFFFYPRPCRWIVMLSGLALYVIAFRIRWWGMKSLGKQWAIHAVGAQKIKKVRLVKVGAYKYMRHPIYLGIVIELVSLPLIANAYFSLLFALLVNIPLQLIRLRVEEKNSCRRFGDKYTEYKREVSALFPLKYLSRILSPKNVAG